MKCLNACHVTIRVIVSSSSLTGVICLHFHANKGTREVGMEHETQTTYWTHVP